ncbi:MAG: GNAT family protein [Dehalococcoidales bacterium]|jgi:RimJ/RimL family protein N-acetyltransferase
MLKNMRIMLCQKRLDDAVNDYTWKTDPELARLDACLPLDIPFNEYLYLYINELQITPVAKHEFSIETSNGEHIGNCAYFNVNRFKGEAEVGIMLGNRKYWGKGYGAEAMVSLIDYIFNRHNFKRVYLKTLEGNTRAQNCFQKCGFTPCGRKKLDGYSFIIMELPRERWLLVRESAAVISRD